MPSIIDNEMATGITVLGSVICERPASIKPRSPVIRTIPANAPMVVVDTVFALEIIKKETDNAAISKDSAFTEGINASGSDHFEIAMRIPARDATTIPIATIAPVEAFWVNPDASSIKENIPIKADRHATAGLIDSGSQKDNRTNEPVKVARTAAIAMIGFQSALLVAPLNSIMISTKPISSARTFMPRFTVLLSSNPIRTISPRSIPIAIDKSAMPAAALRDFFAAKLSSSNTPINSNNFQSADMPFSIVDSLIIEAIFTTPSNNVSPILIVSNATPPFQFPKLDTSKSAAIIPSTIPSCSTWAFT